MRQSDAIKVLDRWDLTGRYVYLKRDLRKLFHGEARDTFDDSLDRLVRSGILVRAARGVYVYRLTRHFSDATPDLIARNLRRGYLVYESLESALSMYGAISQIPVDRRTYMTTGRRGEYRTPYGVIEFTHTARTIDRIAPGLLHPEGRGVPVASKQLALRDLKATGRNLGLVDYGLIGVDAAPASADQYRPSVVRSKAAAGGARKEETMPNPSLTRRINALPDTLSRLMSDPAVSESLARADESKRRLAGLLPLDGVEQSAIDEYRKDWLARYVYNSNAIEGSTLSLKDTELVMEGEFVPTDSPARYIFAARGVSDGMAYVKRFVDQKHPLDIDVIRKLHEITALDVQPALRGEFRPYGYIAHIRGAAVKTADPLEIWDDLEALVTTVNGSDAHPILRAAGFHAMFENIHPFADGNGRTGRQILNMMLMQAGYEPIAIKHDAGRTYAEQLEQWQAYDNPAPLLATVANCVIQEQDRIGEIVSDIRRGHGTTSTPAPYTPLPMPDPAAKTTEPAAPEQGLGMS